MPVASTSLRFVLYHEQLPSWFAYIWTSYRGIEIVQSKLGASPHAGVLRNAGGSVTDDVVKSLNLLRALVNTKMVLIIHHTDCGTGHVTEEEICRFAKSKNPDAADAVENMNVQLWKEEDLNETVTENVQKLREEKSLFELDIYGFVLQTQTGRLREIDV